MGMFKVGETYMTFHGQEAKCVYAYEDGRYGFAARSPNGKEHLYTVNRDGKYGERWGDVIPRDITEEFFME